MKFGSIVLLLSVFAVFVGRTNGCRRDRYQHLTCSIKQTRPEGCEYGIMKYYHGDQFTSDGGCYNCICKYGCIECKPQGCETEPAIKEATQSSENTNLRPAINALDKSVKIISHTSQPIEEVGENPWWMVEYECPHTFIGVTVWNRHECCADQLSNVTIYIDGQECGKIVNDHPAEGGYKTVTCNVPLSGTKVRIEKDVRQRLFLAEVVPIFSCCANQLATSHT